MAHSFEQDGCLFTVHESQGGSEKLVYIIANKSMEEVAERLADAGVASVTVQCRSWYGDLSPWPAQQVYNDAEPFTGGAAEFLATLRAAIPVAEAYLSCRPVHRCIAGYSMAGLFALWVAYNAPEFTHICSASGAVWYEGWLDYVDKNRPISSAPPRFYLSVGNREKKTRNVRMAKVVVNTQQTAEMLQRQGYEAVFELNEGGHFSDPAGRLIKGIMTVFADTKR